MVTLKQIKAAQLCKSGWKKVKKANGDKPFPVSSIIESNDLEDTLWTIGNCFPEHKRILQEFALWCARQVEHLSDDERVKQCNDVTEKYINGDATLNELNTSRTAAAAAAAATAAAAARSAGAAARSAYIAADVADVAADVADVAARSAYIAAQKEKLREILDNV